MSCFDFNIWLGYKEFCGGNGAPSVHTPGFFLLASALATLVVVALQSYVQCKREFLKVSQSLE